MIGYLEGNVKIIGEDFLLIKTASGVGYNVFTPSSVLAKTSLESQINLFIETIVKEDSITLFGFLSFKELTWFKSLLKVSGLGSKTALSILSVCQINDIIFAIENEQKDFFTNISRIGEKLAVRIVNEMKKEPKKNTAILTSTLISNYKHEEENIVESETFNMVKDASLALESLGFPRSSNYSVCLSIFSENKNISLNELIKLSLKKLNS